MTETELVDQFPLWGQIVKRKDEWIGGLIVGTDEGVTEETEITDVYLEKWGDSDTIVFGFNGKGWGFSFNVKYGGISGYTPNDHKREGRTGLTFSLPYSGTYTVYKKV